MNVSLPRLLFEYPATGGCIPSFNFRTVKLIRYVNTLDHFVMACEGIFILFIIYYTIEEILEIKKHRLKYFKSFWNVLDIIVIFLGYVAIVFNLYRTVTVSELLKGLLANNKQYANFDSLGFWQTQFNNMVAIAVFFAWIKVKHVERVDSPMHCHRNSIFLLHLVLPDAVSPRRSGTVDPEFKSRCDHQLVLFSGAHFSKDPRTFRARKAIRKSTTYLFCKAGLFICCKEKKSKNNCKVSCLGTPSF